MLLVIHNLPNHIQYDDVKTLVKVKCNIDEMILDKLVQEGASKSVKVGVMTNEEADCIMSILNGLFVDGQQIYIQDLRKKTSTPVNPPAFNCYNNYQQSSPRGKQMDTYRPLIQDNQMLRPQFVGYGSMGNYNSPMGNQNIMDMGVSQQSYGPPQIGGNQFGPPQNDNNFMNKTSFGGYGMGPSGTGQNSSTSRFDAGPSKMGQNQNSSTSRFDMGPSNAKKQSRYNTRASGSGTSGQGRGFQDGQKRRRSPDRDYNDHNRGNEHFRNDYGKRQCVDKYDTEDAFRQDRDNSGQNRQGSKYQPPNRFNRPEPPKKQGNFTRDRRFDTNINQSNHGANQQNDSAGLSSRWEHRVPPKNVQNQPKMGMKVDKKAPLDMSQAIKARNNAIQMITKVLIKRRLHYKMEHTAYYASMNALKKLVKARVRVMLTNLNQHKNEPVLMKSGQIIEMYNNTHTHHEDDEIFEETFKKTETVKTLRAEKKRTKRQQRESADQIQSLLNIPIGSMPPTKNQKQINLQASNSVATRAMKNNNTSPIPGRLPQYLNADRKQTIKVKQLQKLEFLDENLYQAPMILDKAIENELDILCDLYRSGCDGVENDEDWSVANVLLKNSLQEYRKTLRLHIVKRVMNIKTNLVVRVFPQGPPVHRDNVEIALKPYGVTQLKKADRSKLMFIATCDSYENYDKLCAVDGIPTTAKDGTNTNLLAKPFHLTMPYKFRRYAKKLKQNQSMNNANVNDELDIDGELPLGDDDDGEHPNDDEVQEDDDVILIDEKREKIVIDDSFVDDNSDQVEGNDVIVDKGKPLAAKADNRSDVAHDKVAKDNGNNVIVIEVDKDFNKNNGNGVTVIEDDKDLTKHNGSDVAVIEDNSVATDKDKVTRSDVKHHKYTDEGNEDDVTIVENDKSTAEIIIIESDDGRSNLDVNDSKANVASVETPKNYDIPGNTENKSNVASESTLQVNKADWAQDEKMVGDDDDDDDDIDENEIMEDDLEDW